MSSDCTIKLNIFIDYSQGGLPVDSENEEIPSDDDTEMQVIFMYFFAKINIF